VVRHFIGRVPHSVAYSTPRRQAFVMEKDSKRFPKTGGWGYAVFNYEAASDKFTADPKSLSHCGHACHVAVKAKDYILHPYQKR
jgi:Cytochrome P460